MSVVQLCGYCYRQVETNGKKSDCSFDDCDMQRARGIPTVLIVITRTPHLIYAGVVTAGGNIALLSSRESFQETHFENVLAPNANGPSAAARIRHAENYLSPRNERKLFNRVSCSRRRHLVSSLLFPAC